jgi:hypothetical protein
MGDEGDSMRHVRFDGPATGVSRPFPAELRRDRGGRRRAGMRADRLCLPGARRRVRGPFQAALEEGYARLEAEAPRLALAAQRALRERRDEPCDPAPPPPPGRALDSGAEFDRMMRLLARWDRKEQGLGRRRVDPARGPTMSFRRRSSWSTES